MNSKGFGHVLVFAIIFILAAFTAGSFSFFRSDPPKPTLQPTAKPTPAPLSSEELDLIKVDKSLDLVSYGGYKYFLEWQAYDKNKIKKEFASNQIIQLNFEQPVNLVRVNSNDQKSVVKNFVFNHAAWGIDSYIKVKSHPVGLNIVYLQGSREGTDGIYVLALNLLNGETKSDLFCFEKRECHVLKEDSLTQRKMLESYQLKNKFEENFEALFSYDLLNGNTVEKLRLDIGQTFGCKIGFDSWFKYKYLSDNQVELSICNLSGDEVGTKIITL